MSFSKHSSLEISTFLKYLIIIFTLITFILIFPKIIHNSSYDISITNTQSLFNGITGQPIYFSDGLNHPTNLLINSIAKVSISKNIKISENNLDPAIQLINDCWRKTNNGKNILPANMMDEGVCLYCGSLTTDDKIENLNVKLFAALNKNKKIKLNLLKNISTSVNLNKFELDKTNLINTLNPDETIDIIYYTYAIGYSQKTSGSFTSSTISTSSIINNHLSTFFGNSNKYFSIINYLLSSNNKKPLVGISLTKRKILSGDKNLNDGDKNLNKVTTKFNCKLIIPNKHKN